MSHSPEEVKKHVKAYWLVFGGLLVLTILTVAVSYFHLPILWAVVLAMIIATFKGSLVASVFMHLSTEKKIIAAILVLTVFFFATLLLIPTFTEVSQNTF